MNDKAQALLEAALALEPAERRWLAEALLNSLEDEEEVFQIAEARWKKLEENPDSWASHEEILNLLKRK